MQVLSVDSYHREFEFLGQLNSIVAVLEFLHVSSHLLEGLLLVYLVPVHNARLHLIKQLHVQNKDDTYIICMFMLVCLWDYICWYGVVKFFTDS